jgi:hypothetical protein
MSRFISALARFLILPIAVVPFTAASLPASNDTALAGGDPIDFQIVQNLDGSQFIYVVFHALDRDGFCKAPPGAVSLHPVLGMPVDFVIEAGDGVIIETSNGGTAFGRSANDVLTFSTAVNAAQTNPIASFEPLLPGLTDECQAWIRVSQSIPGPLRVLVTAPADDGGQLAWVADLERESAFSITLNFRWSLVTWQGQDGIAPGVALSGAGGAVDISDEVTAIYGWNAATQSWAGYFPAGANVPGANNLAALEAGQPYWVAIHGPGDVVWSVSSTQ